MKIVMELDIFVILFYVALVFIQMINAKRDSIGSFVSLLVPQGGNRELIKVLLKFN